MIVEIPKIIKIGALKATLEIAPYAKCDDGYNGFFNQRTEVMGLDTTLGVGNRDRVLAHEITHMIDIDKECNLGEENISRIGNGWLEFLRDNLGIELDWSNIQ